MEKRQGRLKKMKRFDLKHFKLSTAGIYRLLCIVLTDVFFAFLVYVVNPGAFRVTVAVILLFTVFMGIAVYVLEQRRERQVLRLARDYLKSQDEDHLARLLGEVPALWRPWFEALGEELKHQYADLESARYELSDYQEFIEQWAHEIKTPLSLSELVLSNHGDEMPAYVYGRLCHVQHQVKADVDRILYYARLKSEHMDYVFEKVRLAQAVAEVRDNFSDMIRERELCVQAGGEDVSVMTDRRILIFMLSQILSNAVKYAPPQDGVIRMGTWETQNEGQKEIHLEIADNGPGVPPEDLPFIFDKGFCGGSPDRKNSTGMGLYLVKKYARIMAVDIYTRQVTPHGFAIELVWKD